MFDIKADPDDVDDIINAIYMKHDLCAGDVICYDGAGYYCDYDCFRIYDNFMQSRAEAERQRQEELARKEQERLAAEERRRKQEEQERRKAEEKQKQQSAPKKKRSI